MAREPSNNGSASSHLRSQGTAYVTASNKRKALAPDTQERRNGMTQKKGANLGIAVVFFSNISVANNGGVGGGVDHQEQKKLNRNMSKAKTPGNLEWFSPALAKKLRSFNMP